VAAVTYSPLMVAARSALLDALVALRAHRDALVLVGAQAVYLYTGDTDVAIATATKDSDIAVVPHRLANDPVLDEAMSAAGFHQNLDGEQGKWLTAGGIPVELLVPAGLQPGTTRGARIPPHDKRAARRVPGLEAAAVEHRTMTVSALDPYDLRTERVNVAAPAALVVAKMHKIGERSDRADTGGTDRRDDKDAHDLYRLLRAVPTEDVVGGLERLLAAEASAGVTIRALDWLRRLAADPDAPLCRMAGSAEAYVGDPEGVAAATWGLVADVLDGLDADSRRRSV
jgi:hypothetical protein